MLQRGRSLPLPLPNSWSATMAAGTGVAAWTWTWKAGDEDDKALLLREGDVKQELGSGECSLLGQFRLIPSLLPALPWVLLPQAELWAVAGLAAGLVEGRANSWVFLTPVHLVRVLRSVWTVEKQQKWRMETWSNRLCCCFLECIFFWCGAVSRWFARSFS